jgi:small subunit ribosomal protein S16
MPVKIRLARHGCRHRPFYHINVANSWAKRDGKYIERLGDYDPFPNEGRIKRVNLNFERVKYWLSVGAQPTDVVARLLSKVSN